MYKLYDSNMNQIPFPEGVVPLDFLVGSISKDRNTEVIPGRSGVMNYGFRYDSRPVTLNLLAIAHDRTDYYLLRNEIYALFDVHDEFYLVHDLSPSRRLKVAVDESFIPERYNHVESQATINCRTLDSVFWESTYTTLELHDTGFNATAEKYGLVDNIDDEKVKYRFTENNFTVYNAGNVTIEPESMMLNIFASRVQSPGDFTIRNKTTGEEIILQRESNGSHFRINGMVMSLGSISNIFRDTNRQFLSLVPGDNQFEILNGTFEEIRFEFKYLYK